MAVPYVVSILEDYLRSTFVALLTYSPRKQQVFKRARLTADLLEAVSDRRMSIEAAAAESFSMQRVSVAGRHFAELDANIDLAGELRRPFRRRRVSPYDSMEELVELRHRIVHRAEQVPSLTNEAFRDIVLLAEVCLERAYQHITACYGWEPYDHFGFGFTRGL
jgi:hypothetical protein